MVKKVRVQEEEEEEEEQYHVEVITKARVDEDGGWEYRVKWANYDSDADSWEPEKNVEGCVRLLKSFWRHIGTDDNDYVIGDTFSASQDWIEREKEFFRESFGKTEKVVRRKKKKKRGEAKTIKAPIGKAVVKPKTAKGKATLRKPIIEESEYEYDGTDDDSSGRSSSESDVPLKNQAGPSSRGQKRPAVPATDSDDSDTPLRKVPRKQSLPTIKLKFSKGKEKGKEPIRPRPSTPTPSEQTDLHSLFSAPPTPEVSHRRVSEPVPQASSNKATASSSTGLNNFAAAQPSAFLQPKPPGPSHRNREPKVKALPLQLSANTGNFTDTKRKIVERTGAAPSGSATSVPLPTPLLRKAGFAGLSFKKKSATDTKPQPSPTIPSPTLDPRKNLKRLSLPESQHSPTSAPTGAWRTAPSPPATAGGWGSVPSPTAETGGWGSGPSPTAATGAWGSVPSPTAASGAWGSAPSPIATAGAWGSANAWGSDNRSSSPQASWGAPQPSPQQAASNPKGLSGSSSNQRPRQRQPPPTKAQQIQQAAEIFLASIMPPEMAAPMHEPAGDEMNLDVAPPPKAPIIKKPEPPREPTQKWKWSGELFMETGPKGSTPAVRLCDISLTEPTAPRPTGLRLNICYRSTTSSLQLEKFHDIADIHLLLRACAPVQQFCKVSHKEAGDESVFKMLATYMTRRRQFAYARAYMDNEPVGLFLVFPSSTTEICSTLKVPSQLRASSVLAALLPWKINVAQYQQNEWQRAQESLNPKDGRIETELAKSIIGLSKIATAKPYYARGLRMHHFSPADYEFFKRTTRKYCVWNMPSDGTIKEPGFETKALIAILDAWKAENAGYKADVRIVFVHVGAVRSLAKLEALGMRRSKRPEMRFYTYGTHHSVHPERWGTREIFPLGGVVTFTAKAILEDPFEIYRLIEQISQHPLWMCYVHPCAVAAVAKISYPASDVLSLLGRNDFFYAQLIRLIEEGKLSLLHVPPKSRSPRLAENDTSRTVDPGMDWVAWALGISSMDSVGIMQECLRIFQERHRRISDKDICSVIEQEVLSDIVQMQLEPVLMDNYRRFVMVVETRNDQTLEANGVELVRASRFDFKDEYFAAT